jgi:energy-coupling factor transporter ATP-binding protein EcfA2
MNQILRSVLARSVLVGLEPTTKPVKCHYYPGDERLLVVTGENASGKSLVRRALTKFSRQDGLQVMDISPEGKARGGIVGAMIYGTEEDRSTGSNSARTIKKAIQTARARQEPHLIVLDEPDAGLSDEYAAGAGQAIAEFCASCPEMTKMVVVVSHRRALVSELASVSPSQLCLGGCPPLKEWLSRPVLAKSLEQLLEADKKMFGSVLSARTPE